MLGGQKWPSFFVFGNKKSANPVQPSDRFFTNEMTLELPHLSPTIKQGSSLFGFKVCHISTSLSAVSAVFG